MKENKSLRRTMGTTLPTAVFVLCTMFLTLWALDVVNIQINARFVGSKHRSAVQAACPPVQRKTAADTAATSTSSLPATSSSITEISISGGSGSNAAAFSESARAQQKRHTALSAFQSNDADLPTAESNITFMEGVVGYSFEERLTAEQERKRKQKVQRSELLLTDHKKTLGRGKGQGVRVKKGVKKKGASSITKEQLRAAGLGDRIRKNILYPANSTVQQKYSFKMHAPASLEHDDMQWCPGLRQVDIQPLDEKFKFLFILGAQKAGTTWLHQALTRHKLFVQAESAYGGGWAKEVRFFNTLPMGSSSEYLNQFPSRKRMRALYDIPTVFLDSTPNYLFSPTVPPRIKRMVPHAKFVIVLRDPVARTVSSHNMMYRQKRSCWGGSCATPTLPLLHEFRKHQDLDVEWPEDLSGCNFNEQVADEEDRRTWGECWRCDHFVYSCEKLSAEEQHALGGCDDKKIPHVPTMPLTQYGLYAAQIAWWLSFFPPESFVILTREELRDPDRVMPALNRILEHVGHADATPFNHRIIGKIHGYRGKYTGDMSEDDQLALKEIAAFFEQPNKDLQTLMDTYFPDSGFNGFTPEYTSDDVNPYVSKPKGSQQRSEKRKQKRRTRDQILSMGKTQPDLLDTATRLPPGIQGTPSAASSSAFSSSSNPPHASLGVMDVTAGPGDLVAPQGGSGSSMAKSTQNSGGIAENTSGDYAAQELEHDTEARGPGGTSSGGPLMVSGPQATSSQTGNDEAEESAAP